MTLRTSMSAPPYACAGGNCRVFICSFVKPRRQDKWVAHPTGGDVILYHRTIAAAQILAEGFRDGVGTYLTDRVWHGVRLADRLYDNTYQLA